MTEDKIIEVSGKTYSISKIDAIKQFHIARRFAPLLSGNDVFSCLSKMEDSDFNFCLFGLLQCVKVKLDDGSFVKVMLTNDTLRNQDMKMVDMMQLAYSALAHNGIIDFFSKDLEQLASRIQAQDSL